MHIIVAPPPIVLAVENSDANLKPALGPALRDDGAAQRGLEVDTEVALADVAQVAAAAAGGEGRELDVGVEEDVGGKRGRAR